jgi:hypothetical protein
MAGSAHDDEGSRQNQLIDCMVLRSGRVKRAHRHVAESMLADADAPLADTDVPLADAEVPLAAVDETHADAPLADADAYMSLRDINKDMVPPVKAGSIAEAQHVSKSSYRASHPSSSRKPTEKYCYKTAAAVYAIHRPEKPVIDDATAGLEAGLRKKHRYSTTAAAYAGNSVPEKSMVDDATAGLEAGLRKKHRYSTAAAAYAGNSVPEKSMVDDRAHAGLDAGSQQMYCYSTAAMAYANKHRVDD